MAAQPESTPQPAGSARAFCESLLAKAGIAVDGPNPWDLQLHDAKMFDRVLAQGSLGLGEAYMDGMWDCEALDQFFHRALIARLDKRVKLSPNLAFLIIRSKIQNLQDKSRVWKVGEVHYDLPYEIFEATFDTRLTGSCGYWVGAADLNAAQDAKLDLVCRKIGLRPGDKNVRVWDIGCGWGAFMSFAAEKYGVQCVGVTISDEQQKYAMKRYRHLPIESRLSDYRDFNEKVDHIVSMGMFEHVGSKNYRAYFETARRAIKDDGFFCLHTIWGNTRSSHIDPWLDKYIFPNGVLPTVGQIAEAVEGLFVIEDVHNFGADYDKTLMAWNQKFQAHRAEMARDHGERFCRMWEYYLLCCAGGFRSRGISVGQFVLSPEGVSGVYRAVR